MNALISRLIALVLRSDPEKIRELLLGILGNVRTAAKTSENKLDDVVVVCAMAIVRDDEAWKEIVDFFSK